MPRAPQVALTPAPATARQTRSRDVDEETREMVPAPADPGTDISGLLTFEQPPTAKAQPVGKLKGRPPAPAPAQAPVAPARRTPQWADGADTHSIEEDLANIGDRTQITAAPRASSYGTSEAAEDDELRYDSGPDATVMTMGPGRPASGPDELDDETNPGMHGGDDAGADEDELADAIDLALRNDQRSDTATQPAQTATQRGDDDDDEAPTLAPGGHEENPDEDGPTMQRDFRDHPPPAKRAPRTSRQAAQAPPALAAKIHSPAVSELRKPRPSRKTPPDGSPTPARSNVLQAIVGAQVREPMPTPRPMPAVQPPPQQQAYQPPPQAPVLQAPPGYPPPPAAQSYPGNGTLPLRGIPAQQPQLPPQQPQVLQTPPHGNAYGGGYGYEQPQQPPMQQPPMPMPYGLDQQQPPQAPPYNSPGQLYAYQPFGQPPMPPTLTGQLRLSEGDELPAHLQLKRSRRGLVFVLVGVLVLGIAGVVAVVISRANHDVTPTVGSIRVESSPPGAEITLDGQRLTDATPFTIEGIPVGTRHEIKVALAHYIGDAQTVDVPKTGAEAQVTAILHPITGKLKVVSTPPGAEIKIDNVMRGVTPKTIPDIDMRSARHLELRLKDYQVFTQDLTWPDNGEIDLDAKLVK